MWLKEKKEKKIIWDHFWTQKTKQFQFFIGSWNDNRLKFTERWDFWSRNFYTTFQQVKNLLSVFVVWFISFLWDQNCCLNNNNNIENKARLLKSIDNIWKLISVKVGFWHFGQSFSKQADISAKGYDFLIGSK